ncbi:MAG: hypothetical protein HND48_18330 [Chloroflexi bacterium]|nr:hypothetical protein [Chloroflexota bacterium]
MVTYADIAYASYGDSLTTALDLRDAIAAFVAEPSEETFAAAKEAWLAANEPYGQTEAYRFYGGPIDDEDGPEGLLNAWPLDEAYVDYIDSDPNAGIINNLTDYPEITRDLLVSLNEAGAEGEHQHRLPRHRVLAVGAGFVRRLGRTARLHRLHHRAQRRTPRGLSDDPRRSAGRESRVDGGGVGARRCGQLPGGVPRVVAGCRPDQHADRRRRVGDS